MTHARWMVMLLLALLGAGGCGGCRSDGRLHPLARLSEGQVMGEAAFSRDGRRVLFTTQEDGRVRVHEGGQSWGPFDGARDPLWSVDSSHWAIVVTVGVLDQVLLDGQLSPGAERLGQVRFAGGGTLLREGFAAERWDVQLGAASSGPFSSPEPLTVVAPGGQRALFVAQVGDQGRVALRDCPASLRACLEREEHDEIGPLVTDLEAHTAAARVRDGSVVRVVAFPLSGEWVVRGLGGDYERVEALAVAEEGHHVTFLGWRAGQAYVVKNGAETPAESLDMALETVATVGGVVHTSVHADRVRASANGKAWNVAMTEADWPTAGPGLRHVAVAAQDGEAGFLVVDGVAGPRFDKVVGPRFVGPERVAYRARSGGRRFVVVAGADAATLREYPRFEAVWDPVINLATGTIAYGVKAGQELAWRVDPLPSP